MRSWFALGRVDEWREIGTRSPRGGLVDGGGTVQAFDRTIPPPNRLPVRAAGACEIDAIAWDTSGTFAGVDNQEVIATCIDELFDGVHAVVKGSRSSLLVAR